MVGPARSAHDGDLAGRLEPFYSRRGQRARSKFRLDGPAQKLPRPENVSLPNEF